ncbi:hypothetical protein PLICRDRAFT_43264 [Plicaturopsis crispa FD-325 SS-3]|nr:hypothetical protein PLICRDRAFT_43264 [Plicaturopsis crispa FD-325 SS-3]
MPTKKRTGAKNKRHGALKAETATPNNPTHRGSTALTSPSASDPSSAWDEYRVREIVYRTGMRGQIMNTTPIIECLWPGHALPPCPDWPDESRFEIVAMDGKGEGMRATKDIAPGEVIVVEYPIVSIPYMTSTSQKTRKEQLDSIFERVRDPEHRAELLGLANCKPPEVCPREEGIVRTNGIAIYPRVPPGTSEANRIASGVFLKISKCNHSCAFNASYKWDVHTFTLKLYAVKPIRAGEEITITYIGTLASSRADRRKVLKERYFFECECSGCALPTPKDVKASDSRRTALQDWESKRPPLDIRVRDLSKREQLLIDYKLAIAMYEKEGLQGDGQYPALMLNLAFIYARTADIDNFRLWMGNAKEQLRMQHEEEHLQRATAALQDPKSFALWGVDLRV